MGNEVVKKGNVANFNEIYIDSSEKYQKLFNEILNNYKIVFQPNISERLRNLNFDFSAFENEPLTNFVTKSDSGKILIDGEYFTVDENIFKLLNIAAFEFLQKTAKQFGVASAKANNDTNGDAVEMYEDNYVKSIKKELKFHYGAKRIQKNNFSYEYYFNSKQDYINSCVNSAILNACLLILADSSVYYDYAQINKEKAKPAGV